MEDKALIIVNPEGKKVIAALIHVALQAKGLEFFDQAKAIESMLVDSDKYQLIEDKPQE